MDFSEIASVRKIPSYRRQNSLPNEYYSSQLCQLIACESRLEMTILLDIEFKKKILKIISQPIKLHYLHSIKESSHIPDFLVIYVNGTHELIDVKMSQFAEQEKNKIAFAQTELACKKLGWIYSIRTELPQTYWMNLLWLGGFRRRPAQFDKYAETVLEVCRTKPLHFKNLVEQCGAPALVRPVVFYMLWTRTLTTTLDFNVLHDQSLVWATQQGAL